VKGRQILVETRPDGGAAAALLVDGRLEDLLIDPDPRDVTPRPEAVHRAVAGRPMKGMGGVILDLGGGATGFLRGARLPAPGARLLVQVSAWAEPGKAPPLSARVTLKGRLAILTPAAPGLNLSRAIPEGEGRDALAALAARAMEGAPADLGLILRSLAAHARPAAVAAEIADLRARWDGLSAAAAAGPAACLAPAPGAAETARRDWRERPDEPAAEGPDALADAGVWEAVAELLRPSVPLGAGALAVEPTRALVAVDVNTGGDTTPAAALKANLAAARELPRQLRLRGLGGQIAVDFAPLAKTERPRVEAALRAALRLDGIETSLAGWTPLGHLELLRKRARRPLSELPRR
jgi:Ribonuclease G/E